MYMHATTINKKKTPGIWPRIEEVYDSLEGEWENASDVIILQS